MWVEFDWLTMNSLMELDTKCLHSVIERARAIHNKLNDEIESSISFCRVCSEHFRYRDAADTSFPERERLIAVRNSLHKVENMLVYLQCKLSTMQKLVVLATDRWSCYFYLIHEIISHGSNNRATRKRTWCGE